MSLPTVTFADILAARERIAPFVHRTPVMTCSAIDEIAGRNLLFKCENFQKVGAFKFRGACNAVFKLPEEIAKEGVVTHSSGNHAQALALAARMRGIAAHIVMPRTAPGVKKRAVAGYGATIYECEPTLAAREATAAEVMARTGATLIHPFDNDDVIAGQGTCALEILEQLAGIAPHRRSSAAQTHKRTNAQMVDAIIAPVGGGGLVSGTCIAVRGWESSGGAGVPPVIADAASTAESAMRSRGGRPTIGGSTIEVEPPITGGTPAPPQSGDARRPARPSLRIFAAEPAGADDAARSLAAGRIIPQTSPKTIADGLLTSLSERTFAIIGAHVEKIITVTDDEIIRAMRLIWERMKIIIEPSSATVLAAVLSEQFKSLDRAEEIQSIGLILSGGNVDLDHLPWGK